MKKPGTRVAATVIGLLLTVILLCIACAKPAPAPTTAPAPSTKPATAPSPTVAPKPATAPSPTAAPKPVAPATTSPAKPASKPIELTYNCVFTDIQVGGKLQKGWCEEVEKRSNGRVTIKFYSSGKLYGYEESERALASGELDMAQHSGIGMGFIASMVGLPFLFDNWDQVKKFHDQGGLPIIAKGLASAKAKPLWPIPYSSITGIFRKSVSTLSDVSGMKLRSPSAQLVDFLGGLGAANVSIATGEVYQALQLGTIDGVISTTESFYARKWYEGARYFLDTPMGIFAHYSTINIDKWNSLPSDIQNLMLQVSKEQEQKLYQEIQAYDNEVRQNLRKVATANALAPDEVPKWVAKAVPVWDKWGKQDPNYAEMIKLAKQVTGK